MPSSHASRSIALGGALLVAAACASGPATHQLGDYAALQPNVTVNTKERSPTHATVTLAAPAYISMLYVVPGRGTAIVYPTDSTTDTRLAAGPHDVPLRFSESPFNRDSLLAQMQRNRTRRAGGQTGGNTMPRTTRDTARMSSIGDPSPSASPIGYLLVVASSSNIPYPLLRRRVEGVTIPIEDDEALSTVMKLVKGTLTDGATLAGYALEIERQ